MGIHIIKMPDIGEGIAEVELVGWHINIGDTVAEDQPLADVMTDKATVEIPSPVVGRVIALGGNVGDTLAVGSELIRLEVAGAGNAKDDGAGGSRHAAIDTPVAVEHAGQAEPAHPAAASMGVARSEARTVVEERDELGEPDKPDNPSTSCERGKSSSSVPRHKEALASAGDRALASPAIRKRAWDLGVELRYVRGSGPAGRILHEDLDAYMQSGQAAAVSESAGYRERHDETQIAVVGLRRKIAQKMQESKRRIPHFSYVEEIDVTELEDLRIQLNRKYGDSRGRLTLLPLLARAMVIAVRDFPQINARYDDESGVITRYGAVHLGVATQTDAGLIVPVVRHAEARDVWAIAREIAHLAQAVRSGKADRDVLSGSTITLSSLGALGGIVSTPVINYPEVGIVGVNRMVERPAIRQGVVVARQLMNLSSSFDHRVVDGMDAAKFIQAVRVLLEQPALLFVEA